MPAIGLRTLARNFGYLSYGYPSPEIEVGGEGGWRSFAAPCNFSSTCEQSRAVIFLNFITTVSRFREITILKTTPSLRRSSPLEKIWKLALPRTPDPNRPTRQVRDLNRSTRREFFYWKLALTRTPDPNRSTRREFFLNWHLPLLLTLSG